MTASPQADSGPARLEALAEKLELALGRLEQARPFAKSRYQHPVLDVARRIML
ncbi:MAG: hypothetical protein GWO12_17235, partial [Gemmatimonadetes bacterium]|nr:hypothetical protein [Candidatus Kutchimonas denitrificans]